MKKEQAGPICLNCYYLASRCWALNLLWLTTGESEIGWAVVEPHQHLLPLRRIEQSLPQFSKSIAELKKRQSNVALINSERSTRCATTFRPKRERC
eukprot:scaffold4338_cov183-Ochromonas_danica.AAC.7